MNELDYLIVDISNIAHMCRHQSKEPDPNVVASLTMHVMFNMVKKYHKKLNPKQLILAFDKPNWRKVYTKTPECVSGKLYKGDRNQNLTDSEAEALKVFHEMLTDFEELITDHTGIITFSKHLLEADDLIGGFAAHYGYDKKITILSSDKDYAQCLTSPNIRLMNPLQEKYRTLEEYNDDVNWHKFFVNIRAGDDNIQSAYPRVRKTRLEKAYNDPFEMANLLNETWTNENGKVFRVGDLYKENCLLKDLDGQPDDIKELIIDTIKESLENPGKYSHFHFLKFCGKHDLKAIAKTIDNFSLIFQNRLPDVNQFYSV